jgi:hypothetical protein
MMEKPLSYFEAWIVRDIRDRCLQTIASQIAMPAGVLSETKRRERGGVVEEGTIQTIVMHVTDLVIERFLFEVDQRIGMGQMRLDLRTTDPESEWVRVDDEVLVFQVYDEWVEKYSAIKEVSDLDGFVKNSPWR